MDSRDIGMVQPRSGLRFPLEAYDVIGTCERITEHLEGDDAIQGNLPGLVDNPHPPCAEPMLNSEITDLNASFKALRPPVCCHSLTQLHPSSKPPRQPDSTCLGSFCHFSVEAFAAPPLSAVR